MKSLRISLMFSMTVIAVVACRSDEVGPITLSEAPSGALVRVAEVKARLSTMVGLGSTANEITSEAREHKNSAGATFTVRVDQALPDGMQMAGMTTCRVGEWTMAQQLTWIGAIAGTPVGESREFHTQFMPLGTVTGEPSACEFSLFHGSPGTRDAPRIEPLRLATVCWTKGELVEGKCTPELLPRSADTEAEPIEISALQGAVQKIQDGKGYGVFSSYVVTVNAPVPASARIVGHMRCRVGRQIQTGAASTLTAIDHLAAGESMGGHGQAFMDSPLATEPDWCTIELESLVGDPTEPRTALAAFCIRGNRAEPGACE
jgi:hypothetical protein